MKNNTRAFKDAYLLSPSVIFVNIIKGILEAITPFISIFGMHLIINLLSKKESLQIILKTVIIYLIISFMIMVVNGILDSLKSHINYSYIKKLEIERNNKIIDMNYKFVEDPNTVSLRRQITVLGYNMPFSMEAIPRLIESLSKSLSSIIVGLFILFPIFTIKSNTFIDSNWILLSFIIYLSVVVYLPYKYETRLENKIQSLLQEDIYQANLFGNFIIGLINDFEAGKEIRLYKQQSYLKNIIRNTLGKAVDSIYDLEAEHTIKQQTMITILSQLATLVLTIFIIVKATYGNLDLGYIVSGATALTILLSSLLSFISSLVTISKESQAIELHYKFMDIQSQSETGSLPVEKRIDNDYELKISNMSFAYPNSNTNTLENINIEFEVGKSYALVGENGSGKTTLIKILTRLYEADEGEVLLNDININKYEASEYYSLFNVVFQDFSLFNFNLGETVATTRFYDEERIIEILKEVGFYERFNKLEKGLDSSISKEFDKSGEDLSGGEKQKLAIARAVYKDGPFYILDEPTSALDPISEFEIYEQFKNITKDKTSILISHRLSSCRFADEVIVLDKGTIVQKGSHDELVNIDGKYKELWNAQAKYYLEEYKDDVELLLN